VLEQDLIGHARLKYLRTSAQKARLVVDLVRGRPVGEAAALLRGTRKAVAVDIVRLLDSAVANARQKRQDIDVDQLYVRTAFVDGGPSLKRIRPAPMGRAFRVLKRMCHVTLGLAEKTQAAPAPRKARGTETQAGAVPAARPARPAARKAAPRRSSAAKKSAGRSKTKRTGRTGKSGKGRG